MYPQVTDAIQAAADRIGATSKRMISRGYHDAGFMAQVRFVPVQVYLCGRRST